MWVLFFVQNHLLINDDNIIHSDIFDLETFIQSICSPSKKNKWSNKKIYFRCHVSGMSRFQHFDKLLFFLKNQ